MKKQNKKIEICVYLICDTDRFDSWLGHRLETHSTKETVECIVTEEKIYYYTTWDGEHGVVSGDLYDLKKEIEAIYDTDGWEE